MHPSNGRRRRPPAARWFAVVLLALAPLCAATLHAQAVHPLDPPRWAEHWTLLDVLHAAGRLDDSTSFSLVLLEPPAKEVAWAWRAGQPAPRVLRAVVRRGAMTSEAVVDVAGRRLVSWTDVPGAQAPWLGSEFQKMVDTVKEHPDFIEAMRRRGYAPADFHFLDCGGGPPGRFGLAEEDGRRIAHVHCGDERYVRNRWTRGISGLTIVYDMDAGRVLRVVDEGAVPLPGTNADYGADVIGAARPNRAPIRIDQPLGPGFTLDGHQVAWEQWRFHVRPDQRVGTVVALARWVDGERERPVLYEGSLSEIFVPYMDPSTDWYPRNFLDAGEYTAGGLIKPLEPGVDCPDHAAYLDMVVVRDNGRPRDVPRVICLFERYAGDPAWRHLAQTHDGRPKRDLVVRSAAVLGNYDYIFDWVFQQDGTIHVAVGATGIAEAKVVAQRGALLAASEDGDADAARDRRPAPDAYGRFVDDHIVAVNHDHYFSFRLDLDVDGAANTFTRDELRTETLPAGHPRRSLWVVDPKPLRSEAEARLNVDMHRPALWRVTNPRARNRVGYATSYQLQPGMSVETLLTPDDWPRRRAGFIEHHLWITPYRADERYAAGMYPTLSEPGEGLPKWTAQDRPIEDTDLVLWYTMGMHHVVRAEDWPVMPVVWNAFELRPFDFFDRNPGLSAPRRP